MATTLALLRFTFNSLTLQIEALSGSLYRTRRDLLALAGLLSQKGIEIDPDEWTAAGQGLDAAHQVDMVFDPRVARGNELFQRMLSGDTIPDEEIDAWLRDVQKGEDT
jgi:hypothetical protein